MTTDLHISTTGHLGRITLDRPKAINALSLEMIEGITAALTAWQADPAIGVVLIEGAGEKGFCSGGDVRAARALVLEGRAEEAERYFATEYRMNALIAGYPKPLVALTREDLLVDQGRAGPALPSDGAVVEKSREEIKLLFE